MSQPQTPALDDRLHDKADQLDGRFALWAGPLSPAVDAALGRFASDRLLERIYARDPSVWTADPAVAAKIANRLGWLTSPEAMVASLPRIRAFAQAVRDRGTTDIVLLGMGGSSLAPEVLRAVVGVAPGWPRFIMLDSTDPDAVLAVERSIALASTLFILASKSGGTIEPNSMAAHFRHRLQEQGVTRWAERFAAITDEGTVLHQHAVAEGYSDVFVNPPDIGGRYSALSFFGLVPAALMGHDIAAMVDWARAMLWVCGPGRPLGTNPALLMGAAMGLGAAAGIDKLSLVAPPRLDSIGLWIEQLVAESTGKSGVGVVPVAGEPLGDPAEYGRDRLFVSLEFAGNRDEATRDRLRALAATGLPYVQIDLPEPSALGAEFVRWELATAVAGAMLGVNPFDEPNVQQAKDATRVLLDRHARQGQFAVRGPVQEVAGCAATLSTAAATALAGRGAGRYLDLVRPGDYVALLAYLAPGGGVPDSVARLRAAIREHRRAAVTFGFGPRYLHSTGQLHKGGPNTGVFVVITAEPSQDIQVPGEAFSFGTLERAQALGDFASLDAAGRRALHLHLPRAGAEPLDALCSALVEGLSPAR